MVELNITDNIGPWMPLFPGGTFLLLVIFLKVNGNALIVCFGITIVLLWQGSNIIHQPFKEDPGMVAFFPKAVDENGNVFFFSQTFLIKGISHIEPGTNSAILTLSRVTKLYNWRDVTKIKFWVTATNFSMEDFGKYYMKGSGSLFGFTYPSGKLAPMILSEITSDVDNDEGINIAKYRMTSMIEIINVMERYVKN